MAAAKPFLQTTRALRMDNRPSRYFWFVLILFFLLLWLAWAMCAKVSVYKHSEQGALQFISAASDISATVNAPVKAIHVQLGDAVRAGDVLVTLDHDAIDTAIGSNRAILGSLRQQRDALRQEQQILAARHDREAMASEVEIRQIEERLSDASDIERLQAEITQRYERSGQGKLHSEIEVLQAQRASKEAAIEVTTGRGEQEQAALQFEILRQAQLRTLAQLWRRMEVVNEEIAIREETLAQLQIEQSHHVISARVDGTVAALRPIQVAEYVNAGASLGTVLPRSKIRVSAWFWPADALGHIRPGQPARVKIVGFPWTQYGVLEAVVSHVAGAVQDAKLQVSLELLDVSSEAIPLAHDLPVVVEVKTDMLSPWQLLLRTAGVHIDKVVGGSELQ